LPEYPYPVAAISTAVNIPHHLLRVTIMIVNPLKVFA
jgi:hypothetical protein